MQLSLDIILTLLIEFLFLILFVSKFRSFKNLKHISYFNFAFLIVNALVFTTIVISILTDLKNIQKGWLLGFLTGLSYLILPWTFYWFSANYSMLKDNMIKFSKTQIILFIGLIIISFSSLLFPDLIWIEENTEFDIFIWKYHPLLLIGQFFLWILLLILFIINEGAIKKDFSGQNQKPFNFLYYSAIITFSTPVFFIIDLQFILLSLVLYFISYILFVIGTDNIIKKRLY